MSANDGRLGQPQDESGMLRDRGPGPTLDPIIIIFGAPCPSNTPL